MSLRHEKWLLLSTSAPGVPVRPQHAASVARAGGPLTPATPGGATPRDTAPPCSATPVPLPVRRVRRLHRSSCPNPAFRSQPCGRGARRLWNARLYNWSWLARRGKVTDRGSTLSSRRRSWCGAMATNLGRYGPPFRRSARPFPAQRLVSAFAPTCCHLAPPLPASRLRCP